MKPIILICFLLSLMPARASHIVGGDIYYDYLGNNNYRFVISVYRDCFSTGAAYDDPLYLGIYNSANTLIQSLAVPYPGSTVLPVVFNNPCVTPPSNICTELAKYQVVVNLPAVPGGYTVSYQRCCRGPNITNLVNPDDTGLTLTCKVPGVDTGANANSSPRFTNYPPLLLCNNDDLIFDHSATDPDGDQLVYSLVTPNAGATSLNPQPIPIPPPGYPLVVWAGGFSAANPLGPGASINIDPVTGLLTASPNLTGLFVVGIRVQEYRNGVLLNSTVRDFLFSVFNCNIQMQAILPLQTSLSTFVSYCQGLTVQFENNSYGGTNYQWDFGVPGITTDVSTVFEPTYTYPAPGSYTATLIVNPGWACTDTAYMDIMVNNELTVSFVSQDSLCIFGNSFDFVAQSTGPPQVTYSWDFGTNANPQQGSGSTVNNVSFNSDGFHPVTVTASIALCQATFTDSIYIFPEPIADFIVPDQVECLGLTIPFTTSSQNAVNFEWDFGVGGISTDVSTQPNPSYTFPGPGTYTITHIAGSTSLCKDTAQATITLNDPILISFTSQDSMCVTNNSFDFDATVSGPPGTSYFWNFGPFATPQISSSIDVNAVGFNTTGPVTVSLTGTHQNCIETVFKEIYLYSEPTIAFALEPGLQCLPFEAHFIDLSWAETGLSYLWDFGDGSTSNLQNPSHLYDELGPFPVTLTISTAAGCITTLSLYNPDLVYVRPNPVADFKVTPLSTDICHSLVSFQDLSEGASTYYYWFDDYFASSSEANPDHLYLFDGTHRPYLIVHNEWQCSDSVTRQVYIEPFVLYVPNTFTPDQDEFNGVFRASTYLTVQEWHMRIMNRWGELVFESFDIETGWDGTNAMGSYVQDGTYFYSIEMKTCAPIDNEKVIRGHVNVLK